MKLIGDETQEEVGNDPRPRSASEGGRAQGARAQGAGSAGERHLLEAHQRSLKKLIRPRGFGDGRRVEGPRCSREEDQKGEARAREWGDRRQYGKYLGPCFLNFVYL